MNYKYYIDKKQNCAFIRFRGEISFNDIREHAAELVALPDHVKGMSLLRDLSLAKLLTKGDVADVKEVIATRQKPLTAKLGKDRRVAWVLSNASDFKYIHQMCALSRPSHAVDNHQPFSDIGKARKWLGLPEDYEIVYPED